MNILSLVFSFLTKHSQASEKASTASSRSFLVDSSGNLEEKISSQEKEFESHVHLNSQNTYHPRFLPDFSADNLSYLSGHPTIRPR